MIPTDSETFGDEILACPVCGHLFTHTSTVTVYKRPDGEDSPTVQTVVQTQSVAMSVVPDSVNPSGRRDAVAIRFWCEADHEWELQFIQHKGVTIVETVIHQEAS